MFESRDVLPAPGPPAPASSEACRGSRYAVAIGINEYQDARITNLKYARADAEALVAILTDPVIGGFPTENVKLLVDSAATRKNIVSAVGTYLKRMAGPEDLVCIFYAGHGATEPDQEADDGLRKYLVPHDGEAEDLFPTGIPMSTIDEFFRRLTAKQVLFFIDSCYSGGANGRTFRNRRVQTRSILTREFLDRLGSSKAGRFVVTSCAPNEVALETDELGSGHGVFTHFLLRGLRGEADVNGDGRVDVNELFDYLSDRVPDAARALGGLMTPMQTGTTEGRIFLTLGMMSARRSEDAAASVSHAEDADSSDGTETGHHPSRTSQPNAETGDERALSVALAVEPATIHVGGLATWIAQVRNTGAHELSNVSITLGGRSNPPFSLAPGEEKTVTQRRFYQVPGVKRSELRVTAIGVDGSKLEERSSRALQVSASKLVRADQALALVVGNEPQVFSQIQKRFWQYVRANGLQDLEDRRFIHVDERLNALFPDADRISSLDLNKLLQDHVLD